MVTCITGPLCGLPLNFSRTFFKENDPFRLNLIYQMKESNFIYISYISDEREQFSMHSNCLLFLCAFDMPCYVLITLSRCSEVEIIVLDT